MKLNSITPKPGSTKNKKRLGRGNASGHGTFSGRGCKGQGQRKSGNVRPGFEGGQTPLIKRIPKLRGFSNVNKISYEVVNVGELEPKFKAGDEINAVSLHEAKLIRSKHANVKLLGDGVITKKLTIKVHKVTPSAKDKILAAGGKIL